MSPINRFNYVREDRLLFPSIEFFAILAAALFLVYLARKRQANLEIAYFLSLPFSDVPFRVAAIQPVEVFSLIIIALNYRKIRLNFVIVIAGVFPAVFPDRLCHRALPGQLLPGILASLSPDRPGVLDISADGVPAHANRAALYGRLLFHPDVPSGDAVAGGISDPRHLFRVAFPAREGSGA